MKLDGFSNLLERMRQEWDGRAQKDAYFYVAFGRRSQTEEDFLASAMEVMPALQQEFVRLPPATGAERRALEIGCGPGRLMIQTARHFGEVQGVDISGEMVALARQHLRHLPNAGVHLTSGADLSMFGDNYFDFVYSYVVFQHIPDQRIVLNYLSEARRVLKPGGVLRCQIRGTPPLSSEMHLESETWTGCFFSEGEILAFARAQCFPLVALSGLDTQYMWTTFRKAVQGSSSYPAARTLVKAVTAASGPGSHVPNKGRESAVSLWIDGMPDNASLADLLVQFNEVHQAGCYLSPISPSGGCQLNARLPSGLAPGEYGVKLVAKGQSLPQAHSVVVFAAPRERPCVRAVTDGINVASGIRLETRTVKVTVESVGEPGDYSFKVGELPGEYLQYECLDPITSTYVFAFHLNKQVQSGVRAVTVWKNGVKLTSIDVEVASVMAKGSVTANRRTNFPFVKRVQAIAPVSWLPPFIVLIVNVWVVWRLFFIEYLDQLPSVEGEFIAMARYIQSHWPTYDWQSLWLGGFPVVRTYQPLVHYGVATLSSISGLSPAAAFHLFGALSYSLGGLAFYYLAKTLSGSHAVALCGGLCFSLFSPSNALIPGVRLDAGGLLNARRLQALVVYGELPNLTGLMLGMFALAMMHRALRRRTPSSAAVAAIFLAAVPATNWPSTVAVLIAVICYLTALSLSELRTYLPRIVLIGMMATAFALPFALPSTILATYGNANIIVDLPTHGPRRWLSEALLLACLILARTLLAKFRTPFHLRFAVLWLSVLGWVVLSSTVAGVAILPLPLRFHIALEIPLTLASVFLVWQICSRRPAYGFLAASAFALFCFIQMFHYRQHAHAMIHRLDVTKTLEYEEARWFDANMHGERVLAPGTVQFWMNVFTDTPQMTGCCEQSVMNKGNLIAAYVTAAGFQSDAESADYSLLWMKTFAVHAVSIGGAQSREAYKQFKFPSRYQGRLPLAWSSGDDRIYRVPARVAGLARIVRPHDLIRDAPANGIDTSEMRSFVAALDDSSLPAASWRWRDVNSAVIQATMTPDQVIAVALNYHSGWSARSTGRQLRVHSDGLGFVVIEPECSGPCTVELRWSPGPEPQIVLSISLLSLISVFAWYLYDRRRLPVAKRDLVDVNRRIHSA